MTDVPLNLVALGVDKASPMFRSLARSMQDFANSNSTKDLRRNFEGLNRAISPIGREIQTVAMPALAKFGIGAGTVAGALSALSATLSAFSDKTLQLKKISDQTGFTMAAIKEFGKASEFMNLEGSTDALTHFADVLLRIKTHSQETQEWFARHGGADLYGKLYDKAKVNDYSGALREMMAWMSKIPDGQRRAFLAEYVFANRDFTKTLEEYNRAIGIIGKSKDVNVKDAQQFHENMFLFMESLSSTARVINSELLPVLNPALEDITKFIQANKGPIASAIRDEFAALGRDIKMTMDDIRRLKEWYNSIHPDIILFKDRKEELSKKPNLTDAEKSELKDLNEWSRQKENKAFGAVPVPDNRREIDRGFDTIIKNIREKAQLDELLRKLEQEQKNRNPMEDYNKIFKRSSFTDKNDEFWREWFNAFYKSGIQQIRFGGTTAGANNNGIWNVAYHPGATTGVGIPGASTNYGVNTGSPLIRGQAPSTSLSQVPGTSTQGTAAVGKAVPPKNEVAQGIADAWRKAGMSEAGIAGILSNVHAESDFNPGLRHADQPKWGGEAHYAHGLYQEGGQEWNNYEKWIKEKHPGGDWRDPNLQNEFAIHNLQKNYPKVWQRMLNAGSPEEAANIYESGYLKPAMQYRGRRGALARKFFDQTSSNPTHWPRVIGSNADTGVDGIPGTRGGGPSANRQGLDTEFLARLDAMYKNAPPEIQKDLSIMSGYRSPERQAQLYAAYVARGRRGAPVAPPGRSQHGFGKAVDLSFGSNAARAYAHEHAAEYGLRFPMSYEPWHIQPNERDPRQFSKLANSIRATAESTSALSAEGHVTVNINGPKGWTGEASANGMFKDVNMNRTHQMVKAIGGPPQAQKTTSGIDWSKERASGE